MAQEAIDVCLLMLKETKNRKFDMQLQCQEQRIDEGPQ